MGDERVISFSPCSDWLGLTGNGGEEEYVEPVVGFGIIECVETGVRWVEPFFADGVGVDRASGTITLCRDKDPLPSPWTDSIGAETYFRKPETVDRKLEQEQ